MSRPDSFNDPFEFRPAVLGCAGGSNETEKAHRKYVLQVMKDRLPFRERKKLLLNPEKLKRVARMLPERTAKSLESVRREIYIYCFSANQTRPLLWSHYSDGHRGIAIEFDSVRVPFNLCWKVAYSRSYPTIVVGSERSQEENWRRLQTSLLIKDLDWEYEQEYRFLAPQTEASVSLLRRFQIGQSGPELKFPPTRITGVTIGAKMPKDAEDDLSAFLSAERPDVIVRKASLARDRFEILINQ